MKKRILSVVLLMTMVFGCVLSAQAKTLVGAEKIKTTAYCLDGITASGQKVRPGICAGADWRVDEADENGSWVADVYTMDGQYIGCFELLDKGGTKAIKEGRVIDVWFETYEECMEYMELTGGKVQVIYTYAVG